MWSKARNEHGSVWSPLLDVSEAISNVPTDFYVIEEGEEHRMAEHSRSIVPSLMQAMGLTDRARQIKKIHASAHANSGTLYFAGGL